MTGDEIPVEIAKGYTFYLVRFVCIAQDAIRT
jgi:hypothetical protein